MSSICLKRELLDDEGKLQEKDPSIESVLEALTIDTREWISKILFQEDWYLENYPEVQSELESNNYISAFDYFIFEGVAREHDPSPYFCGSWYLERYPHILDSSHPLPFFHYILEGRWNKFDPNPLFDEAWYLEKYTKGRPVLEQKLFSCGFEQYTFYGKFQKLNTSEIFQVEWVKGRCLKKFEESRYDDPLCYILGGGYVSGMVMSPIVRRLLDGVYRAPEIQNMRSFDGLIEVIDDSLPEVDRLNLIKYVNENMIRPIIDTNQNIEITTRILEKYSDAVRWLQKRL